MNNVKSKIIFVFLALAATVSVVQGFSNALQYSIDFQWSPSVLFWEGINPYAYHLSGNEGDRIILAQSPNYAHLTYILFFPFTLISWEAAKFLWATTNLIFTLLAVRMICRNAELTVNETLIVLFVFLCSTPWRNTIGSGQHALVVLVCFCALLIRRNYLNDFVIGLGYFKYSFMPPVFLFLLFRKGVKSALFSLITCGLGWVAFSVALKTNPLETLISPLEVAHSVVGNGTADLMTVVGFFFLDKNAKLDNIVIYFLPILLCIFFAYYAANTKGSRLFRFSIISITCLVTFKHLYYDFVLLLPVFIFVYKHRKMAVARLAIGIIAFNWFALKFILLFKINMEILTAFNFICCLALALIVFKINKQVLSK
jgi:hypothetical protein